MKNALITGGSSGMGLEYSRQIAAMGYTLTLVSNVKEQLESAKAEIESLYPDVAVTVHYADLGTPEAGYALYEWCNEHNLIPDLLVCNAGMFFFEELSRDNLPKADTMVNLHVKVNTDICTLFGEEMKRKKGGQIIIMSSMAAKLPTPGITVYSATKSYLLSFGKSLWFEMKPYGVKVTTVCPAAINTPLYHLKPSLMKLGLRAGVVHTPAWLVRKALRASNRGRRVIRPSIMNYYLPFLVAALPAGVESGMWKRLKP